MLSNKKLFFLFCIFLLIFISNFVFIKNVYASPLPTYYLNGNQQNVTFNPNSGEEVNIEIRMSEVVRFTRLYICTVDQECNGSKGNYTRYFLPSSTSSSVSVSWNGKGSGNESLVSEGEYKIAITFYENGSDDSITTVGLYKIFVDFSNTNNDNSSSNSTSTSSNTCTSFTYSSWGSCSNNIQTRTVSTSLPSGCSGGAPEITRSCSSTSTSTNQTTKIVTRTIYVSTHSDEEDLSNYNDKTPFELTAGRERMALVGSPIKFEAKYTLSQNNQCSPVFKWSYGDGFESTNKQVSHTYKFPGEYQIVLNGTCGEYSSVARTFVKVIKPSIAVSVLSEGDIEILNNSEVEINIGDYKISGVPKTFTFAQDTIITSKNKIILSKEDLGINIATSTEIFLMNPSNRQVAYYSNFKNTEIQKVVVENIATSSIEILSKITDSKIESKKENKESNSDVSVSQKNTRIGDGNNFSEKSTTSDFEAINKDFIEENVNQTASVINSIESSGTGFWSKIVSVPIEGLRSLINRFYKF